MHPSGGSIIAHFVFNDIESIEKSQIVAAVRTQEQADSLSVFGVSVILLDLSNSKDVTEAVQKLNSKWCFSGKRPTPDIY